jgi:tetratricopeptide (TPR) repeat protein
MPKASTEPLEAFLQRQEASTLCAVLLGLAEAHEAVKQRLVRLQLADRPDKLAAGFKKTLAAWRRSTKFHGYRESREYGRMLEAWLDQVACELAPKDPPAAVALFESFIESDSTWFEHADDSDGAVGDAVRAACRHWLQTAALCESPADAWPARLMKLFLADEYGARDELLRRANLLLDEPALRTSVAQFEAGMDAALVGATQAKGQSPNVYKMSAALSLLSEALGDPDVKVRAVLRYSPDPNPVQRQSFAQAYLDADRAEDALHWLQGSWGHMEGGRQSLLADALERLGRFEGSLPIRKQMFERSPVVFYLQRWLEHLPLAGRAAAQAHAREVAISHADPVAAATILLELGDVEAAEARMLAEPARIDGNNYPALVPLAKDFRARECWLGETVVYRALLRGILERGYARAYGHGARYLARLREVANSGVGLMPLQSHEAFEAEIRLGHGRKSAFWAHVNGKHEAASDDDDLEA